MQIPDVVGYTLGEAMRIMGREGIVVDAVNVTAPPRERSSEYSDLCRIIKIIQTGEKTVNMLVCRIS